MSVFDQRQWEADADGAGGAQRRPAAPRRAAVAGAGPVSGGPAPSAAGPGWPLPAPPRPVDQEDAP